ncbi:MAG: TolC family protein [Bradymonadaceae bacterium]
MHVSIDRPIPTLLVALALLWPAWSVAADGSDESTDAPPRLSRDDALQTAVANNHDVSIAETRITIADRNASLGNADFLPTLRGVASQRHQFGGSGMFGQNQFFSQTSFGLEASWLLFDGLGRFSTYDRLKTLRTVAELERRAEIERTLFETAVAYDDVVRQRELLDTYRQTVELSRERLEVARSKLEAGTGSKVDVNLARVELYRDRSAVAEQKVALTEAKTELNRTMGRRADRRFRVESDIEVGSELDYDEALERAEQNNPALRAARRRVSATRERVDEAKAQRWPDIRLSLGYTYNEFHNGLAPEFDETPGLEYGTTISIPIFDGFRIRRRVKNARSERTIRSTEVDRRLTELRKDVRDAHAALRRHLERVELARESVELAAENVDAAMAELEAGTATQVEVRQVQLNRRDARTRLIDAKYRARRAELRLQRLMGALYEARK